MRQPTRRQRRVITYLWEALFREGWCVEGFRGGKKYNCSCSIGSVLTDRGLCTLYRAVYPIDRLNPFCLSCGRSKKLPYGQLLIPSLQSYTELPMHKVTASNSNHKRKDIRVTNFCKPCVSITRSCSAYVYYQLV